MHFAGFSNVCLGHKVASVWTECGCCCVNVGRNNSEVIGVTFVAVDLHKK